MNIASGNVAEIVGELLNKRFLVTDLINPSKNCHIFGCTDTSLSRNKKMIVKVSESCTEMTNEIRTLSKCQEIYQSQYPGTEERLFPEVYDYGFFTV